MHIRLEKCMRLIVRSGLTLAAPGALESPAKTSTTHTCTFREAGRDSERAGGDGTLNESCSRVVGAPQAAARLRAQVRSAGTRAEPRCSPSLEAALSVDSDSLEALLEQVVQIHLPLHADSLSTCRIASRFSGRRRGPGVGAWRTCRRTRTWHVSHPGRQALQGR